MDQAKALHQELTLYTLAHKDPSFIHQHAVDAYAAQTAAEDAKPVTIFFALVGLYLHVERDWSGKQVQREHVRLGAVKKLWPGLSPPRDRGSVTVADVIMAPAGKQRDAMIHRWCVSVWEAWKKNDPHIVSQMVKEIDARGQG